MDNLKQNKGLFDIICSGKDYYEIRLESIGGLGANLCGKMLGELGVKYLNLNSSSFSSYGSEKTGTPVKGYIRYCDYEKEIRVHSPVVEPDLLVVFHGALLNDDSVLKGCSEKTAIIIASEVNMVKSVDLNCTVGEVYVLDAQRIAMETHSRINVVMLGAILKVMGIEDISAGERICKNTLGKKYPATLENNINGIRRGYEEVRLLNKSSNGKHSEKIDNKCNGNLGDKDIEQLSYEECENTYKNNYKEENVEKNKKKNTQQVTWGYDNAPIGGINPRIGSTVISDLSPSRQGYIPLFIKERCINCGLCHSTCPDMVFQFEKGEYNGKEMMVNKGLDYYHCKGCLRCVDVCPVNALVRGIESEHPHKKYFMVYKELLHMPAYYEKSGADGYITSESYLTEKRMEGGEV